MANSRDNEHHLLVGTPIIVDENPMVFWDWENSRRLTEFLESIDPTYFSYVAAIHQSQLEGDDGARAAVALRVTYSHALETLFALIGAAIQAPHCPAGWLLQYRNTDLRSVVAIISGGKTFKNELNLGSAGWYEVANTLLPSIPSGEAGDELRTASTNLWQSLARDIVDGVFEHEYNSLKHGFRVQSSDWYFAIGREDVPGTPPPPERMRLMASSRYGSTFLRSVSLKKHQWGFEQQRVNWNPEVFAKRIPLVAASIYNVISFLKYYNGRPVEELDVQIFNQVTVSEALNDPDVSSGTRFSARMNIGPDIIPTFSKEEILDMYLWRSESPVDPQEAE